jgi:hypothetical protein
VLIAIKHDFKNINYDLGVIMAPVTTAWALLILVLFLEIRSLYIYKDKIIKLQDE